MNKDIDLGKADDNGFYVGSHSATPEPQRPSGGLTVGDNDDHDNDSHFDNWNSRQIQRGATDLRSFLGSNGSILDDLDNVNFNCNDINGNKNDSNGNN